MTMQFQSTMRTIGKGRRINWWRTRNLILKIFTIWGSKWPNSNKKTISSRSKSRHCKTHNKIKELFQMYNLFPYYLALSFKISQQVKVPASCLLYSWKIEKFPILPILVNKMRAQIWTKMKMIWSRETSGSTMSSKNYTSLLTDREKLASWTLSKRRPATLLSNNLT